MSKLLNSFLITVLLQQTGFLGVCLFVCLWQDLIIKPWLTGTWSVDKATLKFMVVLMPLPLRCWDNRCVLPLLAWTRAFSTLISYGYDSMCVSTRSYCSVHCMMTGSSPRKTGHSFTSLVAICHLFHFLPLIGHFIVKLHVNIVPWMPFPTPWCGDTQKEKEMCDRSWNNVLQ